MALVKQQFFPNSDRSEVLVEVQLPKGTSIERTSAAAEQVEAWLRKQPEAKIVTAYVGQGAPRFYIPLSPELPDPSFAKIVVLHAFGRGTRRAEGALAARRGRRPRPGAACG